MSHPQANPIEPPAVEPSPQPPLSSPAVQPSAARAYKNFLQEHAQKFSLPMPIYRICNEGLSHFPKFRATVLVNGKSFTSTRTFLRRKEAEQDVASMAYDEVKNQPMPQLPSIDEELVFSKSILYELALKMRVEMPTYITRQIEGDAPSFESALSFNDVAWPPCIGKNKKEAEQLAARAAIHTSMGNAEIGAILAPILRSKAKSYMNMHAKQCTPVTEPVVAAVVWTSTEKDLSSLPDDTMPSFAPPHHEIPSAQHEITAPKPEVSTLSQPCTSEVDLPITFVHASSGQPSDETPSLSKKRRMNRRKANKRARGNEM